MMKKHLFLRLCLMLLVGVSVFSCRTEGFHNEEEAHGNTGLRLTSQRISLSQAKHKAKLLPDLEKAETAIEKKALKVQGKSVNIGNGITIDTDEVIYIENGPDFHTYTFSVIRDNASANAPVENILLTPNTDGSYRVFHIVLNLTEADKAKIANREYVDYKNKQQVTELAGINLSSLTQKQICVPHYFSYPVSCKEGLHEPGQPCAYAGTSGAAYWGSIVLYDCFGEEPETIMPTPMPIDGGGGGGGASPEEGEGQNPPYECTSAATDPTRVGLVSPTGCYIGMPSEPIVPQKYDCNTTKQDLKSMFPNASDTNMQILTDVINQYGKDFGINTKEKLQHFLAQVGHETGGFTTLNVTENLNYSSDRLIKVWPSRFSLTDPSKKNPNNYANNPEKLANFVYCCRLGNGDEASGDGWLYRGRGVIQLTGKGLYLQYANYLVENPSLGLIYNNPSDLNVNNHNIISGLWYFKKNVLDKITIDANTSADKVTQKVNKYTTKGSYAERRNYLTKAKQYITCK